MSFHSQEEMEILHHQLVWEGYKERDVLWAEYWHCGKWFVDNKMRESAIRWTLDGFVKEFGK